MLLQQSNQKINHFNYLLLSLFFCSFKTTGSQNDPNTKYYFAGLFVTEIVQMQWNKDQFKLSKILVRIWIKMYNIKTIFDFFIGRRTDYML